MKTTLNKIRKNDPCSESWCKLLEHLGKTEADDTEVRIADIAEWLCVQDAIWALRAVDGYDREKILFAVWCARQVQHLMTDKRSINAVDVAERYANGEATYDELVDAREAAGAAWSAAREAEGAARAAAWAAGAAWSAARQAAMEAARDAWSAAGDAAVEASWGAARAAQKTEILRMCACIENNQPYNI